MKKGQKMNWYAYSARNAMHEESECYGDGDQCVYFWEDSLGDVFYVGSGKYYRFQNVADNCRSPEFMAVYRMGGCRPRIVAYGMSKEESLDFEKRLITAFWELDFPLVNVIGIPEHEEKVAEKRRKEMLWRWHGSVAEVY